MKREEIIEFVVHREEREEKKVGVCRNPLTRPTGLGQFLRLGGLGWATKFFNIADRVGFGS